MGYGRLCPVAVAVIIGIFLEFHGPAVGAFDPRAPGNDRALAVRLSDRAQDGPVDLRRRHFGIFVGAVAVEVGAHGPAVAVGGHGDLALCGDRLLPGDIAIDEIGGFACFRIVDDGRDGRAGEVPDGRFRAVGQAIAVEVARDEFAPAVGAHLRGRFAPDRAGGRRVG
ncbi:hypothetical protein [Sinorhizobium medicae]|uniref:hypothetical protein n=1 Tax=Sinorhizobium medicae TaxID=110321 RepID=UPI00139059C5|nr:hypothetical protein [Sinorhizobium medicae]